LRRRYSSEYKDLMTNYNIEIKDNGGSGTWQCD
jgi:hypothetical protein